MINISDDTFVKGFRTAAAYFTETTYGTFNVTTANFQKIAGKVKNVNWTARQNIMQTGNVGDGRNYKMQLFGQYDASASLTFEVIDPSFLRYAMGDVAKWNNDGNDESSPCFFVESEMSGIDVKTGISTHNALLYGSNSTAYESIRIRPFSMLLYDQEDSFSGTTWNDSIDELSGCMINDFTLSASLGTPLMCSANVVVKEIDYMRKAPFNVGAAPGSGVFTTLDPGNGLCADLTPEKSVTLSQRAPLMFYHGAFKYNANTIGQVQSFNYSYSNNLITYRSLGNRFINMPLVGMRRQGLTANVIFRIPQGSDGNPGTSGQTSILEMVKNYLGYTSDATFNTTTVLKPALATTSGSTSPQTTQPVEKSYFELKFVSTGEDNSSTSATERGMKIKVYNLAIDGFGVPIALDNGLIEIPITFSVRGYPYNRVSDGSYGGHDGAGTAFTDYNPTIAWWQTMP